MAFGTGSENDEEPVGGEGTDGEIVAALYEDPERDQRLYEIGGDRVEEHESKPTDV